MQILLIEDDNLAAGYLIKGLSECGHVVDHGADGDEGLHLALTGNYDVIVADRMLPRRDGLTIVKMLRADNQSTPVLILSALGEVDDRVAGLRAGGDDYLVKPYAFAELLARIEALARRSHDLETATSLVIADLEIDLNKRRVTRSRKVIRLQPREMRLLEYLMRHKGKVLTRTMLLEQVWDISFDPQTNVVDTHISRLRSKIDKDFSPPLLHTIRGVGYKLDVTG